MTSSIRFAIYGKIKLRKSGLNKFILNIDKRFLSAKKRSDYLRCYKTLNLKDGADQETVRRAFLDLCKVYHPDSGHTETSITKFQEIEAAYRLLQNKFAEERRNVNEGLGEYGLYYEEKSKTTLDVEEFDIRHTAPQHRQYLSYDGVGSGTPYQRQKQYSKHKASVAVESVYEHRIEKLGREMRQSNEQALVAKDKKEAKKIKTRGGIDRLVEDLIQESMSRGEFDNLSGKGKPLKKSNENPYVDFVTHKMNQIMIDNGFVPEWITLHKEIVEDIEHITNTLKDERKHLGPFPLTQSEEQLWENVLNEMTEKEKTLNSKINKYNLLVPILDHQMLYFNLEKAWKSVLERGTPSRERSDLQRRQTTQTSSEDRSTPGLFGFLSTFFTSS